MLTPSWCPTMLWIISVSSTVLPTPAPPKSPALPPRSSGTSTSMTLMPVSKISDLVERSRQRRRSAMHGTPLDIGQRRSAVDGVAKHVEHPRENPFAHRRLQRAARVLDRHAAGETLRGRQRDPAHVMRIALRQHFDDDLPFLARAQHRIDRRQMPIEPHIHDAAAHRDDRAQGSDLQAFLFGHIRPLRNGKIEPTNNPTPRLDDGASGRAYGRNSWLVQIDRSDIAIAIRGERPSTLKSYKKRREVVDIAQWNGQPAR